MNNRPRRTTRRREGQGKAGPIPGAPRSVAAVRPVRRRGVVLLVGIVCLAIASVVFLSLLRVSIAEKHRVDTEAWQLQAAWLAESGLERAVARLADDPGYQGETWSLSAQDLGTQHDAAVRIEVENVPDRPLERTLRVEADYPNEPQRRARYSKQVLIEVQPNASSERR
jgi:hypothetical protein